MIHTVEHDKYDVRYTDKIELSNGLCIQIAESMNKEEEQVFDPSKMTSQMRNIKVNKVSSKPIKSSTIFLTKQDEYVGHVSANIYDNETADMAMFNLRTVELPEELEKLKEVILDSRSEFALNIAKKHQGQGIGKQIITILLNYLNTQKVKDLTVTSISNERAMNTYLTTGAEKTGDTTAIYRNIKSLLKDEEMLEIG